jgi:hypothetical protein
LKVRAVPVVIGFGAMALRNRPQRKKTRDSSFLCRALPRYPPQISGRRLGYNRTIKFRRPRPMPRPRAGKTQRGRHAKGGSSSSILVCLGEFCLRNMVGNRRRIEARRLRAATLSIEFCRFRPVSELPTTLSRCEKSFQSDPSAGWAGRLRARRR